jgi:phage shock protein A
MLSFIRNLIGVKADQAVDGAVAAIVRWDPQSATEAELRTMEQNLDEVGRQVAQARAGFDKERREADAIQALSRQRMAAAEQISAAIAAATDPAARTDLERSLSTLVAMLEEMAPEVDREKQDVVDAEGFLRSLEETYQQAGQKLKSARAELTRAQRDMGRAEQQRAMAERKADAARQAAGLAKATSGLSVALKAMQESAARDLQQAEAANAKARLLTPTKPETEDRHIAAAMAQARGEAAPGNLSDRLAALRARQ